MGLLATVQQNSSPATSKYRLPFVFMSYFFLTIDRAIDTMKNVKTASYKDKTAMLWKQEVIMEYIQEVGKDAVREY